MKKLLLIIGLCFSQAYVYGVETRYFNLTQIADQFVRVLIRNEVLTKSSREAFVASLKKCEKDVDYVESLFADLENNKFGFVNVDEKSLKAMSNYLCDVFNDNFMITYAYKLGN